MSKSFEDLRAFQRAPDRWSTYAATEPLPKSDLGPAPAACGGSFVSRIAEGQGRLTNEE
jgi:hypothetical protein